MQSAAFPGQLAAHPRLAFRPPHYSRNAVRQAPEQDHRFTDVIWNHLSHPWRASVEQAWAAYCAGSVPIGAVIVNGTDRIVARGRNRMFEPTGANPHLAGTRLAHAEMNALLAFASSGSEPGDCTLHTTTEPCVMCIGAIRMHKIRRVRYAASDPLAGGAALAVASPFMQQGLTSVVGPQRGDLQHVLTALLAEFLTRRHASTWAELAEALDPGCGAGARLGRTLAASGALRRLGEQPAPAGEVMDWLATQLSEVSEKDRLPDEASSGDD